MKKQWTRLDNCLKLMARGWNRSEICFGIRYTLFFDPWFNIPHYINPIKMHSNCESMDVFQPTEWRKTQWFWTKKYGKKHVQNFPVIGRRRLSIVFCFPIIVSAADYLNNTPNRTSKDLTDAPCRCGKHRHRRSWSGLTWGAYGLSAAKIGERFGGFGPADFHPLSIKRGNRKCLIDRWFSHWLACEVWGNHSF